MVVVRFRTAVMLLAVVLAIGFWFGRTQFESCRKGGQDVLTCSMLAIEGGYFSLLTPQETKDIMKKYIP